MNSLEPHVDLIFEDVCSISGSAVTHRIEVVVTHSLLKAPEQQFPNLCIHHCTYDINPTTSRLSRFRDYVF